MTAALYDTDFYSWTVKQANLLRHEDYADLDIDNLIEEIEDMGRSEQRELEHHMEVLLRHLLKVDALPNINPTRLWRLSVREQRRQVNRLLRRNPGLRPGVPALISDVFSDAREGATDDLTAEELSHVSLPVFCPWTPEQILDPDFFP